MFGLLIRVCLLFFVKKKKHNKLRMKAKKERGEREREMFLDHSNLLQLQNGRYSIGISSGRRTKQRRRMFSRQISSDNIPIRRRL